MRYLFLGLLVLILSGCGSNNNKGGEGIQNPTSPQIQDATKQPPQIPNLNQ